MPVMRNAASTSQSSGFADHERVVRRQEDEIEDAERHHRERDAEQAPAGGAPAEHHEQECQRDVRLVHFGADEITVPRPRPPARETKRPRPAVRAGREWNQAPSSSSRIEFESVSDAGLGHEVPGRVRIGLQLAAQVPHVDAEILLRIAVRRAPDRVEELTVRHRASGVGHQRLQQAPLGGREVHGGTVARWPFSVRRR